MTFVLVTLRRVFCRYLQGCFLGAALAGSSLAGSPGIAQAAEASTPVVVGRHFTIDSAILHEQRQYDVHLPPSYGQAGSAQRRYPVLYMLDGENFFISAADVTDFMSSGTNGNYTIPEMIVVGVVNTRRTHDMTPTHIEHASGGIADVSASGGAADFLSFMEKELMPRIDGAYRTMPYRILAGHSFAGLAVINAFEQHPSMFQATIAIDPSLWWDDELMLKRARAAPVSSQGHNRLYLALANTPSIDGPYAGIASIHMHAIRAFAGFMQDSASMRDRFKLDYFASEEHGSVPLLALYNGLAFVFEGYKLSFADGLNHPERIAAHFEQVSTLLGTRFPPPEQLVNGMGYMALNDLKDSAKAIALFTINTQAYPQSANAYDSLGEAYARAGRNDLAADNYRKSLGLNPGNANARAWLDKQASP